MATHLVINPDILTNINVEKAFFDISCDPLSPQVTYTVFVQGGPPQTVQGQMNVKNFATSPDLFGIGQHKTTLVQAVTASPTQPSAAVLRQVIGAVRSALTVPPSDQVLGQHFCMPIFDTFGGGHLFLGNPSGSDAQVTLQWGSSSSPVAATVTVPAFGVQKTKLEQAQANLIVKVTNGMPVIAQVAIGPCFQIMLPS